MNSLGEARLGRFLVEGGPWIFLLVFIGLRLCCGMLVINFEAIFNKSILYVITVACKKNTNLYVLDVQRIKLKLRLYVINI
jgi:hypothetical protein